jgi:hypothetical protein
MGQANYREVPQVRSQLEADPGVGAMLNLGDCHEKNGQTASAWAEPARRARRPARGLAGSRRLARAGSRPDRSLTSDHRRCESARASDARRVGGRFGGVRTRCPSIRTRSRRPHRASEVGETIDIGA